MPVHIALRVVRGALADVVQERRPSDRGRRHRKREVGVPARVKDVILLGLFEPAERGKLRDEQLRETERVHEREPPDVPVRVAERGISGVRGDDPVKLRKDALLCDVEHETRVALCGREGLLLRKKAEFRRKAHQPEHPVPVFGEHLVGLPHCAEHLSFDVFRTAEEVRELLRQRVEVDGVCGEVPPRRVLTHILGESDALGTVRAAARGIAVRAERCVFRGKSVRVYPCRAEAHAFGAYGKTGV